jgi:hypothetical protein
MFYILLLDGWMVAQKRKKEEPERMKLRNMFLLNALTLEVELQKSKTSFAGILRLNLY